MNETFQTLESGSQYMIYLPSLSKPIFLRKYSNRVTGTFPVNSMILPNSEFAASTVFIPHLISEVNVQEVNEINIPVNVNDKSQKRSSNSDDLQNHVQVNQCLQK